MEFPGRLIAGFLVVVLILIFPLQYIAGLNNESFDALVDNRTHQLSDAVRENGYIDKQMYEEYIGFLDTTGERYEIELQDIKPVKGEDISSSEANTKQETRVLRTGADNSIIAPIMAKNEIQSFVAHTHTDDCYAGHRHNESCASMPLKVKYTRSTTWGSRGYIDTYVYCGYCDELILSINITVPWQGHNSMTVWTYLPDRQLYMCEEYVNPEYRVIENQTYVFLSAISPYRTNHQEGSGGGSSYLSSIYHVPSKPNDLNLPFIGNITTCPHNHTGKKPREIIVSGGWNGDEGSPESTYLFKCSYCEKTFIKYNEVHWNRQYSSVSTYSNDVRVNVYTDTNTLNGFSNIIGGNISKDELKINMDIYNHFTNHGCSFPEGACEFSEDTTPICNQVVTSIIATNPTQTVKKGEAIITTVTATYLDGHTDIVTCTSDFNTNQVGDQIVTLSYSGLVGNAKTTETRTCTINVKVLPIRSLTSIAVLPEYQDIQRYSLPVFTVSANYDDGTSKVLNSSEYSVSGFNGASIGLQNVVVTYTEGGITRTATVKVNVTALTKKCPRCNQIYELNPDDTDPGCPYCRELIVGIEVTPNYVEVTQGDILPITVMGIYNDGTKGQISGWISNFDLERIGLQIVTVQYQGYAADITVWVSERLVICPVCDAHYPTSEDGCPVCSEKVIRIEVLPKEITVMQFEPIPLTVTAYYADGSSKIVDDWAIDRTTVIQGTFIATVSYKGVSDAITLTVLSINSIECPICHTIYDLSESPKGCPICSEEIIGIEAYLTSGTNLVQLGTTPAIAVVLIFRDEHREFAKDGYELENYNPRELGIQTVRVLYKGFVTTIIIEVVNRLDAITCPNGHVYYKNSDGTDPGCPFCHEDDEVSKIAYFDITYTSEILGVLYSSGIYHFQEGNYISVITTKKDKSLMYQMQKTFFGTSMLGRKKQFIYGGEVY